MARTANTRTPSVSQVRSQISKQVTALRAHESSLTSQLNEVQEMIASFGNHSSGTVRRGRKRGRPVGSKSTTTKKSTKKVKTSGAKRGRPKGSTSKGGISLSVAIEKSMRKGKNYSVTKIKEGIGKAGYKSSAKNFSVMINQTLGRLMKSGVINRVERGVYVRIGETTAPAPASTPAPTQEAVTAGSPNAEWSE